MSNSDDVQWAVSNVGKGLLLSKSKRPKQKDASFQIEGVNHCYVYKM